ncbi:MULTISPECIES: DNA repair protein RecN [unclassified Fusibacter]|uniref:DNA repair protein RecN n=1 Tax=unclassified Fusibacter TaxID=2624464 RepID=UPI0010125474|nr:DNA repair protein RecN [Fusibacter sp. A1]MCK8058877.1 DNA repair protein RecN [Fusibacter sp. A2]NPE21952.1 DNA repair protein RecN [Fusibacter sp. A1]RXV61520.1 DNA repair protein RecN [Fusibacter sp. A1]
MLVRLHIKDYIIIESLDIDFGNGFNVLTGETGAGKSILLGALRLVLGERLSGDVIRNGAGRSIIQAVFELDEETVKSLSEWIELEDTTLIMTREVLSNGKSLMKINDVICTMQTAKQVGELVLAIHGQFDHQNLLLPDHQLTLVDAMLDQSGKVVLSQVGDHFDEIKKVENELNQIIDDPLAIERELELLTFQMTDIDESEIVASDEDLDRHFDAMKHSEGIITNLQRASDMISGEDYESFSIERGLSELIKVYESVVKYQPQFKERVEWLTDVMYQLKDLIAVNDSSIDSMTFDPYELLTIEKRLDKINHLKRKYGQTVEQILDYRASLDLKIEELEELRTKKDRLVEEKARLMSRFNEAGLLLRGKRQTVAKKLTQSLTKALKELNFEEASVELVFTERQKLSSFGIDQIEIYISLNKGMSLNPLKKVASGGEISRVMLALKSIIADYDAKQTLIFDEIDAGISGTTASIVAEKLYKVSLSHQVICISHLAQVALMADNHYVIEKSSNRTQTLSTITELDRDGRIAEIARIMGGLHVTQDILDNAQKLIQTAERKKGELS